MLPVVIPYRPCMDGLELRYALRSLDLYVPHTKVYLVGEQFPSWIKNVEYIRCSEESIKSSKNILYKVWAGLIAAGPTAIQWQDDIYITRPTPIHYWAQGTLSEAVKRYHGGYKTLIVNTAMKITDAVPYYDVHTPIIYERQTFKKLFDYDWTRQYLIKTLYCHLADVSPTPYQDIKIGQPGDSLTKAKESLFFSTGPQGLSPDVIGLLDSLYPNPSSYEAHIRA